MRNASRTSTCGQIHSTLRQLVVNAGSNNRKTTDLVALELQHALTQTTLALGSRHLLCVRPANARPTAY
jgi:hypothetical protein